MKNLLATIVSFFAKNENPELRMALQTARAITATIEHAHKANSKGK